MLLVSARDFIGNQPEPEIWWLIVTSGPGKQEWEFGATGTRKSRKQL